MNVHNNLQGLQQLFASQEVARTSSGKTAGPATGSSTDEATLSSAASAAAQAAPDSDVRMEKVAAGAEGAGGRDLQRGVVGCGESHDRLDAGQMSGTESASALAMLREGIAALAQADAPRLERLLRSGSRRR